MKRIENGATKKPKKSAFREYAEAILIAIIIALLVRTFAFQAYKIPSASMRDTLLLGDYIMVNKLVYKFVEPKRGDIAVFKYPLQDNETGIVKSLKETYELVVLRKKANRKDFVKRVIAVPGDVIAGRGGEVILNDDVLREPYLRETDIKPFGPYKVPEGSYFVMGDNRTDSRDSRDWGYVERRLIKGRAWFVYWSWIPDRCPRHASPIRRLTPREQEEPPGAEYDGEVYLCEGGGEIVEDWYDARLGSGFQPWKSVRWSRVLRAVK
ncbi:MAG: signal peptidase I [bacterium]|nr:signal peptidase I [bacterium]